MRKNDLEWPLVASYHVNNTAFELLPDQQKSKKLEFWSTPCYANDKKF